MAKVISHLVVMANVEFLYLKTFYFGFVEMCEKKEYDPKDVSIEKNSYDGFLSLDDRWT